MKAFGYLNKSRKNEQNKGNETKWFFKLHVTLELFLEVKDSAHCSTT